MGLTFKDFIKIDNTKIVADDNLVFKIGDYDLEEYNRVWDRILYLANANANGNTEKFIGVTVKYSGEEIKFLVRADSLYFVGFYTGIGENKVGYAVDNDTKVPYRKGGEGYNLKFDQGQILKYFAISKDEYKKFEEKVNKPKELANLNSVWSYFSDENINEVKGIKVRIVYRFMETLISEAARMETARNIFNCVNNYQNESNELLNLENHQPTMGNWIKMCKILGNGDEREYRYKCISIEQMQENVLTDENFVGDLNPGDGVKLTNIGIKLPVGFDK